MKKILIIGVALLAICISISAVSADEGWSFNFSSSDSSNTDGGQMKFDNGKLNLQDLAFTIPDGFKENESARKLAEAAEDVKDAKYSACEFIKDGKEIVVKVFFSTDGSDFTNITPDDASAVEKTIAGNKGYFFENKYGDNTPTFQFIKEGKLVEVNAPDEASIESVIKG